MPDRANGCELEIHAVNNAYYNIEGLGIKFVASPRHADLLLVTGPVSRHMEIALKRTYECDAPNPSWWSPIGDCGCDGGIFGESYATCGKVSKRHPGGCGGERLPAHTDRHSAGYSHGNIRRSSCRAKISRQKGLTGTLCQKLGQLLALSSDPHAEPGKPYLLENDGMLSLQFDALCLQSEMNIEDPDQLVFSYTRP